jgi:hypothetical protein
MNYSFQNPLNGWWICASYDIETNYLHIQPLDSVEQYIELFNESNPNPITPEEIHEAKKHWAFANDWCNERSNHFSTPKEAELYL